MKLTKRPTPAPPITETYRDPAGERAFLLAQGAKLTIPNPNPAAKREPISA